MPRISQFFGIEISMYYNDHNPPHFHAKYAEHRAKILICTATSPSSVLQGSLPNKQLDLVLKWATLHCVELMENWERIIQSKESLKRIDPLT